MSSTPISSTPYPSGTIMTGSIPIEKIHSGYLLRSHGDSDIEIFVRNPPRQTEPYFIRALDQSSSS